MDEQHPRNPDGTYQAHCTRCGTYVDDTTEDPGADFLCCGNECQYDEETQ